jgi:ubiquinone/menaquinone biosynthesis C-methylase UbiE
MSTHSSEGQNSYFIDGENAAEMERLIEQDHVITRGMGGLFAALPVLSNISRVLDLGCGPGGWAREVAFAHPEAQVEGIDNSQMSIEYANAEARTQGLDNAHFQLGDITKPLDYPDDTFDLVNGRMIGFLPTTAWRQMMHECLRVTKSGGIIRLTEFEAPGTSNSAALENMIEVFARALATTGQNFATRGHRIGITPVLRRYLKEAGAVNLKQMAHVIDYSADTENYESFLKDWRTAFKLLEPFLMATGVITAPEFDQLYDQMLIEMMSKEFCAVMFLLTVTGEKPEKSA